MYVTAYTASNQFLFFFLPIMIITDGDNDWMDVQGGHDSAAALAKAGNPNCSVHVVPEAGHHLYLDNPEVSNRLLDEAIRAVPKAF